MMLALWWSRPDSDAQAYSFVAGLIPAKRPPLVMGLCGTVGLVFFGGYETHRY